MTDFEDGLIDALKMTFGNTIGYFGCYWHYCRATWKKATDLKLKKKDKKPLTKFVLSCLAVIIHQEDQDLKANLFKELTELIIKEDPSFEKLLKYFQKNWLSSPFINYKDEVDWNRTNNVCEGYHAFLSKILKKITNSDTSFFF